jgi:patatin-like phospholipase/acyl hydrolase
MPDVRIFSFDGGGIRGVLTAVLLNRLLLEYPRLFQDDANRITIYAGTSTGGILALGLASGMTPAQIRDLYGVDGKSIFDASWMHDVVDVGGLTGSKYDNVNLQQILQNPFGGRKLSDLKPRVLIASFKLDNQAADPAKRTWSPKFFQNFPGRDSDGDMLVVDVAMATSAAPTYFPSYEGYIDGGVIANNPSMAAVAQALDARNEPAERAKLDDIRLLSIGTGISLQYIQGQTLDWGDAQWIRPIINILMDGSVGVADFQCLQLLGDHYFRLEPVFPPGKSFQMDDVGRIVDLLEFARSVDLTATLAWLKASGW